MSCFVPGCKTGYRSQRTKYKKLGMKNLSLFRARTEDVLNDWRLAISSAEKYMTRKDLVCERHFHSDDIEREYTHKMPDGSICRIQKGKATLKPGAIPSISLDCMENTSFCDTFPSKQQSCELGETSNSLKKQKLDSFNCTLRCGCKQDSKNNNIEQKKTREKRKASKLTYSKDEPKKSNITAKEKTLPVKAAKVSKENVSVSASTKACLKRKRSCPKRKPLNDAKSHINVQSM